MASWSINRSPLDQARSTAKVGQYEEISIQQKMPSLQTAGGKGIRFKIVSNKSLLTSLLIPSSWSSGAFSGSVFIQINEQCSSDVCRILGVE